LGLPVQLGISEFSLIGFNRKAAGVRGNDLFKTIRDRLVDFFDWKLDKFISGCGSKSKCCAGSNRSIYITGVSFLVFRNHSRHLGHRGRLKQRLERNLKLKVFYNLGD